MKDGLVEEVDIIWGKNNLPKIHQVRGQSCASCNTLIDIAS